MTSSPSNEARSLAPLVKTLANYFVLPAERLTANTRLRDDLGFDSLQMFEVLVLIEEAAGQLLEVEELGADVTLGALADLLDRSLSSTIIARDELRPH